MPQDNMQKMCYLKFWKHLYTESKRSNLSTIWLPQVLFEVSVSNKCTVCNEIETVEHLCVNVTELTASGRNQVTI